MYNMYICTWQPKKTVGARKLVDKNTISPGAPPRIVWYIIIFRSVRARSRFSVHIISLYNMMPHPAGLGAQILYQLHPLNQLLVT
jgi:hypothetical protein